GDVELDIPDALHVSRLPFPASRLEEFLHPLLELLVLLQQLLDPVHQVFGLRSQHARRLLELTFELADQRIRSGPRHRLDAAHAGRGARLVREPEQGDLTRAGDMRPATQLDGHARHVHDAHDIAVLLGEERHRPRRDGFLVFHLTRGDGQVRPDVAVHFLLDPGEGRVVHWPVVREVEAQPLRGHDRALLADVGAEHLAQRRVHQVRRRVVPLDVLAARLVDLGEHRRRLELIREVAHDGAHSVYFLHALHVERPPCSLHPPRVAHLSARLGVERILLQHHLDHVARLPEAEHIGLGLRGIVADPLLLGPGLHGAPFAAALHVDGDLPRVRYLAPLQRLVRAGTLLAQLPFEPGDVHRLATLAGDQLRQIDGKAERVVQLERLRAGDGFRTLQLLQPLEPALDRVEEALFFDTIEGGLERLEQLQGAKAISGAEAFKLYDTFGFPIDLTQLIAGERGQTVDVAGFERELGKQRTRSHEALERSKVTDAGKVAVHVKRGGEWRTVKPRAKQKWVGYDTTQAETDVLRFRQASDVVEVVLQENPFYAESGGQVSD